MSANKLKYEELASKNEELNLEIQLLKNKIRQLEESGNKFVPDHPLPTTSNIHNHPEERQFHEMFETNRAIKLIIDPENGKIVKANKSAVSFYGYPEKVLTSMHINDINILSESEIKLEMDRALTEQRLHFNFKHKLAKGDIRDVEVFSGPFQSGETTLLLSIIHDITKQLKALKELRENETLLRTIAENYPNSYLSIIEKDLTCGYTAGQEFKKQNLDPKAFIGLSLVEIFGEHEPFIRQQYNKTFAGEEQSFELYINNQHQHYRTIPFINEKGEINRILSVVENISERKESESALKKSKERLDLIIRGSQDAPWDWDFAKHEIYYSPQWWKQLGYAPDELPVDDQLWHKLLHPDDINRVDGQLREGLKSDMKSYELEFRLKHKNGHYVPVLSRGIITRDENGNVTRLSGTNMDISERKKAEAELLKAKETAVRYLDMAGSIFVSLDINGNIILINRKGLEVLEYEYEELIGKNWFETCLPKSIVEEIKAVFNKVMSGKMEGVENYDNEILTKSGKLKTISWNNSYLKNELGEIEYLFSSGIDVTEVRKAERERKESQQRYQNFISKTSEGIYRIEMKAPVPVNLPEKELIQLINKNSIVAEVNNALAQMYGLRVEDMKGKPAVEFAPNFGERAIPMFKSNNYQVKDQHTRDVDKDGNIIHLSETYHGEIEEGKLIRIWGVQRNITNELIIKNELLEMQERFEQAMNATKDGLFDWNLITNEIYYSPGWKRMLGYEYDELPNDFSIWETLTEAEDVKRSWEMQKQVINKERDRFEMEFKMKHKDGHWVDILSRAYAIFDSNGKALRFVGTHVDISERKQWEIKLMENEERFRKMIEYMPNGVLILEPVENGKDFKFLSVNNHAEKLSNAKREVLIGQNISKNFPRIKNSPLFRGLVKVNQTGDNLFIPPFLYKDNIREGWREVYIYKLESGEVVAIVKDVTDIQTATKKLEDSQLHLSAMLNAIPDMVFRMNRQGVFLDYKAETRDLYTQKGDFIGKSHSETLPEPVSELIAININKAIETNEVQTFEYPLNFSGRGKRYYETKIAKSGENDVTAIVRDITTQKTTEEEIIKAKEKAEESDRLKSAFLANMSHEIRTPMNGILGFADLLKEPNLSGEDQQKYVAVIEKSGERMLNIINDLIDISKIEAGQMEVKISKTNIAEQAEYLSTFFRPEMEKKGIKYKTNFPVLKEPLIFRTDREKLYAIITNLLKNAIKYTSQGSIEFGYHLYKDGESVQTPDRSALSTHQNHQPSHPRQSILQFYVKDTGIGIPEDRLEAVFERFIQADIEDKKAQEGAGLGLAITKAYAEMLGGKIWVESTEGEGTTFYFTIPDQPTQEKTPRQETIIPAKNEIDGNKKLKILVAEDDEISKLHLSIVLGDVANEIMYARTGKQTVEIIKQNPDIDVILMDIKMPVMDGYTATRNIREFNKDVIIIAQTAYALAGDRQKAIQAGCNDYLAKPIQKEHLLKTINISLHRNYEK